MRGAGRKLRPGNVATAQALRLGCARRLVGKHLVLIATATIALCGCSPESHRAHYTVEQYVANPDAMDAKLEECANNPGDSRADPDCVNVKAAAERKAIGSLRDHRSMSHRCTSCAKIASSIG